MRQPAWQPPCAWPSQRTPSRCTALRMRYMPVEPMVSHSFTASLSTRNRRPQNCSISGMNGSDSSSPCSSSVARISASLRTSTISPTRRSSDLVRGLLVCTAAPLSDRPGRTPAAGSAPVPPARATARSTTSAAASGRRAAFVRRTPSRRARDVSGSAARCIAVGQRRRRPAGRPRSRSRRRARSCRPPPSSATTTTGAPAVSASTTTRPMKSWRVGNTNAWQAWKAPLRTAWSTVPRKVTSSSTPRRRASSTRRPVRGRRR